MMNTQKFVLWGYGLKEYKEVFALADEDLKGPILEYGAGASTFNQDLMQQNVNVISADALYAKTKEELEASAKQTFENTFLTIEKNAKTYNLRAKETMLALKMGRLAGINRFLDDFEHGREAGRYQSFSTLPLPFENYSFKLALVCHHLFVNPEAQSLEQHLALIRELVRVAGEVRIFPLIDRYGQTSNLLGPVLLALQQEDEVASEVKEVPSQIQPTGNAMLRVWTLACDMK